MKALIRNKYETITEDMNVSGLNWKTGAPLTNPAWAGGPYILDDEYTEPDDAESVDDSTGVDLPETRSSESEGAVTEPPSTVTYGEKEYTLDELKKLIG